MTEAKLRGAGRRPEPTPGQVGVRGLVVHPYKGAGMRGVAAGVVILATREGAGPFQGWSSLGSMPASIPQKKTPTHGLGSRLSPLRLLVRPERIELPAIAFEARRSIH
jgi:hypothetical protein